MNEHAISWFAIPVEDLERARTFYSTILDITMPDLQTPGGTCAVFPQMETGISGSLNPFMGFKPTADSGVTVWLNAGDDLQIALDRVEAAGGKILKPKEQIGEFGHIAMILDCEGNRIGLHSPN
jgi:predicted enzyme related to lactoylglutathione lyase